MMDQKKFEIYMKEKREREARVRLEVERIRKEWGKMDHIQSEMSVC